MVREPYKSKPTDTCITNSFLITKYPKPHYSISSQTLKHKSSAVREERFPPSPRLTTSTYYK